MNMNMVDMVEGIGLKHQIPAGVGLKRDIALFGECFAVNE